MLITRFNRFFDRHGRLMMIGIGVVIIIPFVFFVTPGRGTADRERPDDLGEMYGRPIDYDEFLVALNATDMSFVLQYGRSLRENNQMFGYLVEETLNRIRALREVKNRGIAGVTDEEVAHTIRRYPYLQKDKEFDRDKFNSLLQNLRRAYGIEAHEFDRIVADSIVIERLEQDVRAAVFVAPAEVRQEFERANEEFQITAKEFRLYDMMSEIDDGVSDEAISEYFGKHREELRLPDQKRVRAVVFQHDAFRAEVSLTDAEVQAFYENNKKTLFADSESLEQARPKIETRLLPAKMREAAQAAANLLLTRVRAAWEHADDGEQSAAELFAAVCGEAERETVDSGLFTIYTEVANVSTAPIVARAAYLVTPDEPFSKVIFDSKDRAHLVACWLETVPGATPAELSDPVRDDIRERLLAAQARQFYEEHVAVFREDLGDGKTPEDLKTAKTAELAAMTDRDLAERQRLRREYEERVDTFLRPYFVPEEHKVRVAAFTADSFAGEVEITAAQLREHHEGHPERYAREEVRVRQILLRLGPQITAAQKAKRREQLANVRKQLAQGTAFGDLARIHSEDNATKASGGDMGFLARGTGDSTVTTTAFGLADGEISGIVETGGGLCLLKRETSRDNTPFAEVSADIRDELMAARCGELAEAAARDFADSSYDALRTADADAVPVAVFQRQAAAMSIATTETDWFRERGVIPPYDWKPALREAAYALAAEAPLSDVIKDGNDFYVACWLAVKDAYLPQFEADTQLTVKIKRHVQREKAKALACDKAAALHAEITASLNAGQPFVAAAANHGFEVKKTFTRTRPLTGVTGQAQIMEKTTAAAPGTLLEPLPTTMGAVLVHLDARGLPDEERFEQEQAQFAARLLGQKGNLALQAFYERLKKESNTVKGKDLGGRG